MKIVFAIFFEYKFSNSAFSRINSLSLAGNNVTFQCFDSGITADYKSIVNDVKIYRFAFPYRTTFGSLLRRIQRLLSGISLLVRFFYHLVRIQYDVYHAVNVNSLLLCWLASNYNNSKLVYETWEIHPFHYGKNSGIVGKLKNLTSRFIEHICIKRCQTIFTITPAISEAYGKLYNVCHPITLLNCPPRREINRIQSKEYISRLLPFNRTKAIKVVYLGLFSELNRLLTNLIRSFKWVGDAILVIIGYGTKDERKKLLGEIAINNLDQKVYLWPPISPKDFALFLDGMDIGVIPFNHRLENIKYYLPGKLFDYLVAGLAIISSPIPLVEKIVVENKVGYICNFCDDIAIAKTITSLCLNQKVLKKMQNNASILAREKYNWQEEEKKLLAGYEKYLKK